VRDCRRHGSTEFALYGQADPRWRCKRCVGDAVRERQRKIKRILVREAGGKCSLCGYDRCIASLQFHHVDPQQKSFGMSAATGKSLAAYREEARKCVLLCANCHGEIEAGILEL